MHFRLININTGCPPYIYIYIYICIYIFSRRHAAELAGLPAGGVAPLASGRAVHPARAYGARVAGVDWAAIAQGETARLRGAAAQAGKAGVGVTVHGARVAEVLGRTMPCAWDGKKLSGLLWFFFFCFLFFFCFFFALFQVPRRGFGWFFIFYIDNVLSSACTIF
jgi:hypothetical protein